MFRLYNFAIWTKQITRECSTLSEVVHISKVTVMIYDNYEIANQDL